MAELREIPAETREQQAKASDPTASAWVSANAGSGKTYVLAQRVIRLLLERVEPSRILCLTFTKAAAAEMSNRIFEQLGRWVTMDDADLAAELENLLGRRPSPGQSSRARTLFALALDTPGGLKIQTIHAFCEALLHQFPLEANVPGHFEVADDLRQRELLEEARRLTLAQIDDPGQETLRDAFALLIDQASDPAIDRAVGEIVAARERFDNWIGGDVDAAMAALWRQFDLAPNVTHDELIDSLLAAFPITRSELVRLGEGAREQGGTTNLGCAEAIERYLNASDSQARFRIRNEIFLTKKKTARARIVTRPVLDRMPEIGERLAMAADRAEADLRRISNWRMLKASASLFRYADALLGRYQSLKRGHGVVDFGDLIARTKVLLTRSEVRDWIRYKLDRGIDHVLIDEAQDTSPEQWEIIDAIVLEFFAGEGTQQVERTVFAVGDEKQSIFSFQGADPERFALQRMLIERRARDAGKAFHPVQLRLSFRSSPDILGAVDKVFSLAENARGLGEDSGGTVHEAIRANDPGEVRLWPIFARPEAAEKTDWLAPIDAQEPDDPAVLLARRIAETIAGWIGNGEKLPGRDRPIRHGDILILVRKRDRFMTAVIRELKEKGLRIAGADRLKLTEHIAIEDLMALGRVMVMPQDDLALAAVLKSPLFGVDEEALLALCTKRDATPLWTHLERLAGSASELSQAAGAIHGRLQALREKAASETVYGFYAHVLGRAGGRQAFLGRLGSEANDVIDAFEEAALEHERHGGGGLEDFLASFSRAPPEIKREIDVRRDEIRVITVHAAKGLEAPIVFLVDPCSPAFIGQHAPSVIELPDGRDGNGFLWIQGARDGSEAIASRLEQIRQQAEAEYRRLLYVAMTRAADRLIVCGYRGVREPKEDHWHRMIERALGDDARQVCDAGGNPDGFVWQSPSPSVRARAKERPLAGAGETAVAATGETPAWLQKDAAPEPAVMRPLNPSAALALTGKAVAEEPDQFPADAGEAADSAQERRRAMARGTAVHRLLQILPDIDADARRSAGERWLARNLADRDEDARGQALAEALRLIADRRHATLFGPGSRAEAGIAGNVRIGGRDILVSGQIDRLAVGDDEIVLADFKTNRHVPGDAAAVDERYRLQLALYRALLAGIYPDRRIRCLLIWTRDGSVTELDGDTLDAALGRITPP